MNATDTEKIRKKLEQERAELLENITGEQKKLNNYAVSNPDPSDLADKSFYQDITQVQLNHLERQLEEVEAALKRIDSGEYGLCAKCGNPINPERLEAMPEAIYCMDCKQQMENPR
jgi:RNA polymerase-binding transcription factor